MQIIIARDYEAMSDEAAVVVVAEVDRKPDLVLGLASGKSPAGLYERLGKHPEKFERVRFFDLDEFYGVSPANKYSFHHQLKTQLIDRVKHDPANVRFLRGNISDLQAEAVEYEEAIRKAGGIDLQILGLGKNGHLGFNEPGSSLASRTRPKVLEPETLADHMKTLDSQAPVTNFTITMGLGTIMEGRRLLLVASGREKAEMAKAMVEGPVTAEVPASILQMHPNVTAVLDEAAAALLKRRDYWKWVYENKWRVGQKQR